MEPNPVDWSSIPNEIWNIIFSKLEDCSAATLQFVCKKWKKVRGVDIWNNLCADAARDGQLSILRWARQQGCRWSVFTSCNAAENGHLHVLKWLWKNGFWENGSWSECNTLKRAAAGGHLDIMEWLMHNGCSWYMDACVIATREGRLEVLKWANDMGYPWDADNCLTIAKLRGYGHIERYINLVR